jgi:hypothetical protein
MVEYERGFMLDKDLRQKLFDLLSVRFEKLMLGTEFRNDTSIVVGNYSGDISVDENRFYLSLHAKETGYMLHNISLAFTDDNTFVLTSISYFGGKIRRQYFQDNLFYDKDLGLPNEVLYGVVDVIRNDAQLIKIIQLVNDIVDVELRYRLDSLVDFLDFSLYLKSTFSTNILSLGPAFIGQIELKCDSNGDNITLTTSLFKKVSGKLLYNFEVVKKDDRINIVSTLYASDGVSVDKTICFGEKGIKFNDLYECISILDDTFYKDALIELITRSGF